MAQRPAVCRAETLVMGVSALPRRERQQVAEARGTEHQSPCPCSSKDHVWPQHQGQSVELLATALLPETSPEVSSLLLCLRCHCGIASAAPTAPSGGYTQGGSLWGCARALGRSTAPGDPLQGQKGGAASQRCAAHPSCGWVFSQGWGENLAGMGRPTAKPPCPHAAARGDGTVGTRGQGSPWPHASCPMGLVGVPQSDSGGTCAGLFPQPQGRWL